MQNNFINKYYILWLKILLVFISFLVVLGGYTRLTDSGLSIMEWQVFKGFFPPLSLDQWQRLFNLYQQIPQFKNSNSFMDITSFKQIFWLEYFHRLVARMLGLIIIIPALYFIKFFFKEKRTFLIAIIILLLFQGFLGWFMVQSGFFQQVSVSHFRLAIHLFFAFLLFSIILQEYFSETKKIIRQKSTITIANLQKIFFILVVMQIIYGAFVAGQDAGLIYNQFPFMGDKIYPEEFLLASLKEKFLYDQASLQFLHRIFATILLLLISIIFMLEKKAKIKNIQTKIIFFLIIFQYLLGIATILTVVNTHIAVFHQFIALWIFGFAYCWAVKSY